MGSTWNVDASPNVQNRRTDFGAGSRFELTRSSAECEKQMLPPEINEWLEFVLLWIGFGTCVGLLAKALMPGRDPGGAIATLLMGIVGSVIGSGVFVLATGDRIRPISVVGLFVGVAGAFVILLFYRMLAGFLIDEAGSDYQPARTRPRRRRRTSPTRRRRAYEYADSYYDD